LDILSHSAPDGESSIGAALHRAAGGEIPGDLLAGVDDPVKSALDRMAIDAYPLLLAPVDRQWRIPRVSLFQHPLRAALQASIQADPALARLFPEEEEGLGRSGYMYTSLGRGGGFQDAIFGEMIIASAWDTAAMATRVPALSQLIEQIHRNVDTLRLAAAGKQVAVPARVICTGFTTHGGRSIATPWGPLRPLHEWERDLAPAALEGAVTSTHQDGKEVTVSYASEMLLETEVPYAIVVDRAPDPEGGPTKWPVISGFDTLWRHLEAFQLSVLLAADRPTGSWVTARLAWRWVGDPFGHGANFGWQDAHSTPAFMPYELSDAECDAVAEWASRVDAQWTPRIDISARRLLSAANSRTDMADRLVDAVIVWENLFGTSQGEVRFRISSALAWLLEAEPVARETLQRKLKILYDYRSQIVHGGNPDEAALGEHANNALSYSREALRTLLRDRPDILALSDGAARSLRLIMGS
jgi:Apea-like HEPN